MVTLVFLFRFESAATEVLDKSGSEQYNSNNDDDDGVWDNEVRVACSRLVTFEASPKTLF